MTSFIAEIKKRLPEADWPVVVASLRSNPQVWAELQDNAFGNQALDAAGDQRRNWSPGFLGLLRLRHAGQFNALKAEPMQAVSEKLRYEAAAAFEQLAGSDKTPADPDLAQATLLALALRERRRLLNGWEQLAEDLSIAPVEFWLLPIACLLGLLPNQHELLEVLLDPQHARLHPLGAHALIANPLAMDVQASHLLEITQSYPLPQLIELLRLLSEIAPELARQAATQALESLGEATVESNEGLTEIQRLMIQAEIYQISGQSERAAGLLQSAWQASQELQIDLATRVAEANGQEPEELALVQMSAKLADPKAIAISKAATRRPAALLSAAKVAFESQDAAEARDMALAALRAAREDNRHQELIAKSKLLHDLGELFVDMELPREAEMAAKAAVELNANNAENAALLSQLLQSNGHYDEAIEHAHLAAALDPECGEYRRLLADALEHSGQAEEAFAERKAVIRHSELATIDDWLAAAQAALASGQTEEAIQACQQALEMQPAGGSAHALMGSALAAQGDAESAITYLQRATELSPSLVDAWMQLIELQHKQGNLEAAAASIQTAQKHTEPSARLQSLLADIHASQAQDEQAMAAYQAAAQLAADQAQGEITQHVALALSRIQLQAGQQDAALHTLEAAQKAFPSNVQIAAALGLQLLGIDEFRRALSCLSLAAQAMPEDTSIRLALAKAQIALGEAAAAEGNLQQVVAANQSPAEAQALLAEAQAAQDKYLEAAIQFDAALKTDLGKDNDWRKRLLLGKARVEAKAGKPMAAISTLDTLNKFKPNDLDILRALCDTHQQAGHADQAALLAQKVYLGQPEDEATLLWYAERMSALDKSAEACRALSKSAQGVDGNPRLVLALGKLKFEGESPVEGLKSLSALHKSQDPDLLSEAGNYLLNKGAAKDSIAFFEQAAKQQPNDSKIAFALSQAQAQAGQLNKALDAVDQAIAATPNQLAYLQHKAEILERMDKPQAALQTLEAALKVQPGDARLLSAKAQLLRAAGDWSGAYHAAAGAFERSPQDIAYLQAAAELAVLCLQPEQAQQAFTAAGDLPLTTEAALLLAELQLSIGEEIEAAKTVADLAHSIDHPRLLALQSQLTAARGDRAEAQRLLEAAVEQANDDVFTQLSLAAASERLGAWDQAVAMYQQLAEQQPSLPVAQFGLGRALTLRAEWQQLCAASQATQAIPGARTLSKTARQQAKKAFAAVTALVDTPALRTRIAGWTQRAELRFGGSLSSESLKAGFPANAAEAAALFFATQHDANSMDVHTALTPYWEAPEVVVERAVQADDGEAASLLAQAAAALKDNAPVQALAAQRAFANGEAEAALGFIHAALALWPQQPAWQSLAGQLQTQLGRLAEASQHFKLASDLEPENAAHVFALGEAQAAAGMPAAVETLQKAVDMQPKNDAYLLELAKTHRQLGHTPEAKHIAQKAHKANPDNLEGLILQAELALEEHDATQAKSLIQDALKQAPKLARALQIFAETLYALGNSADAIAVLERARETAEDEVPLLLRKAQMQATEAGLETLVNLSRKYPERAEVFFALSQMLALSGRVSEAIQNAQQALKVSGGLSASLIASIQLHLGQLLKQDGNLDQSLHHLDVAVQMNPKLLDAHMERGRVFLARRQHQQALAAFEQAAKAAPSAAAPHLEAGLALKEAKDFDRAEQELRQAAKLAPKQGAIQKQLAAVIAINLVHHRQAAGVEL